MTGPHEAGIGLFAPDALPVFQVRVPEPLSKRFSWLLPEAGVARRLFKPGSPGTPPTPPTPGVPVNITETGRLGIEIVDDLHMVGQKTHRRNHELPPSFGVQRAYMVADVGLKPR